MALAAAAHEPPIGDRVKSVRDYIDETPVWPDGTTLASTPMTAMQWRIWWLAAAGQVLRGAHRFYDRRLDATDRAGV
jgi:hypothetical protein